MQSKLKVWGAAGLALLVLAGGGCAANKSVTETPKDTSPIKIGWMGPLTGDVATIGAATKQAAELAVKEINDAGGVDGRQLVLLAEDAGCDAKTASNAGNKLINVEKVTAIVGGYCSGETLAVAPVAEQTKTVMVSPASSAPSITNAGDYIFRVTPSDSYQGKFAANYVYNTLGKRKAAVLFAKVDYTEALSNVFAEEFKKLGGEVVLSDSFLQTARDLKTQMSKVKDSGADVLYFATYTEAGAAGLKQAQELGLNIQIIGIDTYEDPKLQSAQGAEGAIYTVPASLASEEFKTKFMATYKTEDVPAYVPQTYDTIKLLAAALAKSGSNTEALKTELYNVKNYDGVSGLIGFDDNGDLTTANFEVKKIENGKATKL